MPNKIYLWHPVFVHFSVALLCIAALFFGLAMVARSKPIGQQWVIVAQWNLWLGIVLTGFTVVFGWLAFNSVNHDDASHELMLIHRNWALGTTSAFLTLALWSLWDYRKRRNPSWLFATLMIVASGLLLRTAFLGGELVYGHGLAVSALPQSEEGLPETIATPPSAEQSSTSPPTIPPDEQAVTPDTSHPHASGHHHHHHHHHGNSEKE